VANDELSSGRDATADEARRLVEAGESASVEFKSSIRYDYETGKVNRELSKALAKTVAGFINATGGNLFIGVSNDGSILGIERDMQTLSTQNLDGYERAIRNAIASFLGVEISPRIAVTFIDQSGVQIAWVKCHRHESPVFLTESDRPEFYVRDGNQTRPLDVRASHEYIHAHWPAPTPTPVDDMRTVLHEVLGDQLRPLLQDLVTAAIEKASGPRIATDVDSAMRHEAPPNWITIATRRVLDLFLGPLAHSPGWKRIYLISPWLSEIEHSATLNSNQFLRRVKDDGTTVYVVTRPPVEDWHVHALNRLGETGRANVAIVPGLHIKLYTAITQRTSFAMLGSANFTQQALINREIGLMVSSYGDGRRLVSQLNYEAANIYRLPERRLIFQASFRPS